MIDAASLYSSRLPVSDESETRLPDTRARALARDGDDEFALRVAALDLA
jgi:hypothetical protein